MTGMQERVIILYHTLATDWKGLYLQVNQETSHPKVNFLKCQYPFGWSEGRDSMVRLDHFTNDQIYELSGVTWVDSINSTRICGSCLTRNTVIKSEIVATNDLTQENKGISQSASQYINILAKAGFEYEVVDAMGRTTLRGTSTEAQLQLRVADLPSGLYAVKLPSQSGYRSTHFVVNK